MDKNYDYIPATIQDALKLWDSGKLIWSIEMGGLGPSYEQTIQIGIFELSRDLLDVKLPSEDNIDEVNTFMDKKLYVTIKRCNALNGLSGAMAGVIKNVAYRFKRDGYKEAIITVPKDRLIQVDNGFPSSKD